MDAIKCKKWSWFLPNRDVRNQFTPFEHGFVKKWYYNLGLPFDQQNDADGIFHISKP